MKNLRKHRKGFTLGPVVLGLVLLVCVVISFCAIFESRAARAETKTNHAQVTQRHNFLDNNFRNLNNRFNDHVNRPRGSNSNSNP